MAKKKMIRKPIKQKKSPPPKPKVVVAPPPPVPEPYKEPLQVIRGMRDILPSEEYIWRTVKEKAQKLSRAFGYGAIETPILEHRGLFARGVGNGTDIVQKEMYSFKDQGGDELCLRPENTAAVGRAYINHGMSNLPQPVKLWYLGPFFRRERPQAGRYRQFHQWGIETLGDSHPVLDAEVISIAYAFFQELKLSVTIEMNSIGCEQCRSGYKEELRRFYTHKRELLCEACKARLESNVLRLLDCKEPQCELLKEGAPQLPDALCEACREHFMKVLEYLDEVQIPYNLNPHIVRGLDYYNRTVFEVLPVMTEHRIQKTEDGSADPAKETPQEETNKDSAVGLPFSGGAQSALGGGGRYDGLVEQLGGRPTPAVGFSIGLERVIAFLRASGEAKELLEDTPRIFIAQLGDVARRKVLTLWHTLGSEVPVVASLSKDGLKAQLEIANRLQVRYAIIIGQKEIIDKTAIIRDMEAGMQEVVDYNKLVNEIKKKLAGGV